MELFPDRAHVRLRSRVRGTFLYANKDGMGVSLSGRRASVNTVWLVHRVQRDGHDYVLLHSAANGRYLAISFFPAPPGHRGRGAEQNAYVNPPQVNIAWEAIVVGEHFVLMRHVSDCLLRANGMYRLWNNGVSVDDFHNQSMMMHWRVEAIPSIMAPPALPLPPRVPELLLREIEYVRADDDGNLINPNAMQTLWFVGRSVLQLRTALADALHEWHLTLTLCVRAGNQGRLVPLITDLPRNEFPLFVAVLTTGSPGENLAVSSELCSALVISLLMECLQLIILIRVDYTKLNTAYCRRQCNSSISDALSSSVVLN
ncbi:hypothetical protein BAE44_0023517 [Dichanthelium oligosanthes]|uniref:Uncharacterized protein n=1 Tax=Dichanthelium oligosanthes TaxID=888268 RepID=A0A1E5URJ2_9POAL|nr:hypothetical protein BAE44_0023517 [Dichanthelium oligosanthes]